MLIKIKLQRQGASKGSILIETGVFLPVFVLGLLTLAYLIKIIYIQNVVFQVFADRIRIMAAETYAIEKLDQNSGMVKGIAGLTDVNRMVAPDRDLKFMLKDADNCIKNFDLGKCGYVPWNAGKTEQVKVSYEYDIMIPFPIDFYNQVHIRQELKARAWTGNIEAGIPMSRVEFEDSVKGEKVYVFPRSGEKYHKSSCPVISSDPVQTILTESVRKKYSPCRICNASELQNGSIVYCFSCSGYAYHDGRCPSVVRYVIAMQKRQAEEEGYQPCIKCGGN